MRKIIGIGETILDIIFRNNQPSHAVPGGSTFNTLISLGRLGVPATFISEIGKDTVGDIIIDFMKKNGVCTENLDIFCEGKTPISLAFLDENNEARYMFYNQFPEERLNFVWPRIEKDDIIIFGSYFALNPALRKKVCELVEFAKERKAIIAGNWKLNKRVAEIPAFTQELQANLPAERCCDVVICAPYPLIAALETAGQGCHLGVGAQDVSEHQHGAFTGEVSAEQLSDLGAQYCIVGHSERRSYHGETDLQVNAKTKILLDNSITPIICVGESLAQREHDLTETYVAYQVAAAFSGLTAEQAMHCVIAYEPLWAIGTGNTATSAQAQEVCASIRATLGKLYDLETAQTISILYGGSMNAGNAAELLAQPDIDGGLIGGASLKPVDFSKIVAATAQGACE